MMTSHDATRHLTTKDLDKLERLAKAATSGPYQRSKSARFHTGFYVESETCSVVVTCNENLDQASADASYLSALDPATVLALVALARR